MTVRFDVDIKEIDKKFDKWARKFRQKKKIHRLLATGEYDRTVERFRTKRDPDDQPWAPLAGATIEQRERRGTLPLGILLDSGELRDSIQVGVTRNSFIIGTNLDYAEYHQEGTPNMPERSFMGFNDEIFDDFQMLVESMMQIK